MPPQLEPVEITSDEVREACRQAQVALDLAMASISTAVQQILRAGRLLKRQQQLVPEGEWMEWIDANLPIKYSTVRNWIRLASFAERKALDLENAATVRQAYVLAGLLPEPGSATAGSPPPGSYLLHVARVQRSIEAEMEAKPLLQWTAAEKKVLRDRLEPLVLLYRRLEEADAA